MSRISTVGSTAGAAVVTGPVASPGGVTCGGLLP